MKFIFRKEIIFAIIILFVIFAVWLWTAKRDGDLPFASQKNSSQKNLDPLTIEVMRARKYPRSAIKIEETLDVGVNYSRYIASYKSDGLKIFGLLTVPDGSAPKGGWPAIVFNHGYIAPQEYVTTERYVAYQDTFARRGYVVFKIDYRGNGNSEGKPEGAYQSPAYTVDVLNALASLQKIKNVNPKKIGVWGHSMGGTLALRAIVVSKEIKAAVIWAGVVGNYEDIFSWFRKRAHPSSAPQISPGLSGWQSLIQKHGEPNEKSAYWKSIDPYSYLSDVTAPVQLHHGTDDESVSISESEHLYRALKKLGKKVEFYSYEGADHNISDPSFTIAINRSAEFFDKYLK